MLLLGLTLVAACSDGICYLGLGRVFPANMTGNTVLLGLAVATGDGAAAARSATALGAFLLGAFTVGAVPVGGGWTRGVTALLAVQLAALATWAGWWNALPGTPAGGTRYGLIGLAGLAMGLQSGAVRRLHVSGIATTYITGTWTAFAAGLGARAARMSHGEGRRPDEPPRALQAVILGGYLCGALACGVAERSWHGGASVIPAAVLAVVVVSAVLLGREGLRGARRGQVRKGRHQQRRSML